MVMTSNRGAVPDPAVMSHSEILFAGLTIRNNNSKMKSIRNIYSISWNKRARRNNLAQPERLHVRRHWTATEMQRTTTQMHRFCTIRTTELNDINRGRN